MTMLVHCVCVCVCVSVCVCVCLWSLYSMCFIAHYRGDRDVEMNGKGVEKGDLGYGVCVGLCVRVCAHMCLKNICRYIHVQSGTSTVKGTANPSSPWLSCDESVLKKGLIRIRIELN